MDEILETNSDFQKGKESGKEASGDRRYMRAEIKGGKKSTETNLATENPNFLYVNTNSFKV